MMQVSVLFDQFVCYCSQSRSNYTSDFFFFHHHLHYLMSTLRDFYLCLFVGGKSQLVGVVWLLKTGVGMSVALGSVVDLFLHTACHSNSSQSQLLQGSSQDQALRSSESCDYLLQERHVEVRQKYGGSCSPWWWRWCRKTELSGVQLMTHFVLLFTVKFLPALS